MGRFVVLTGYYCLECTLQNIDSFENKNDTWRDKFKMKPIHRNSIDSFLSAIFVFRTICGNVGA